MILFVKVKRKLREGDYIMKKIALTLVIIMGMIAVLPATLKAVVPETEGSDIGQQLDRFNPFIKEENRYVKTADKYGTPQSPGGYNYSQKSVNDEGEVTDITFYAGGKLKENAYLKLDSKGSFVESWEEVPEKDVPEKALAQLTD